MDQFYIPIMCTSFVFRRHFFSFSLYILSDIFSSRFLSSLSWFLISVSFHFSYSTPIIDPKIPLSSRYSLSRTHPRTALFHFFSRFSLCFSPLISLPSSTVSDADFFTILFSRPIPTPLPSPFTPSPRRPSFTVQSSSFSFPPPHVCERVESAEVSGPVDSGLIVAND